MSTVAIIINCYNDAQFVPEAIASAAAQTRRADEILIVDDGSFVPAADILGPIPGVTHVQQQNAGLAAARNLGLASIESDFVIFLDADDRLTPKAVEAGLACFAANPDAVLVYGGHRRVDARWRPTGADSFRPVGNDAFCELLRGNLIAMHAAVMYRAAALRDIGGFDSSLRTCEDYDIYLRLARHAAIATHEATVAEYRWHGANMSQDAARMLSDVLAVHAKFDEPGASIPHRQAWLEGRANWRNYYEAVMEKQQVMQLPNAVRHGPVGRGARRLKRMLRLSPLKRRWPPVPGNVRMGDLGSTKPISMDFGFDRGLPIDRYYIERFLAHHAADIAGKVMEVGDDSYSRRFGTAAITGQDVLHAHAGNPLATIVGDIGEADVLPAERFDCIIFTQTLQFVFDVRAAIAHLHRALRPGGILLLTSPGISQIDRGEWGSCWYWAFTRPSFERLLGETFGEESIDIGVHGNVFAATAMLQGLAVAEVDTAKLDVADPAYPVVLTVRAQKK